MYRIAKLSLNNRSVVALITIVIAAFGFLSLGSLKQELIPSFATPQAAIVTSYPGASPQVIDKLVSQPIENAVRSLDGLVTSTSTSQNNISIVRVEFDYGTATDKVKQDLASALATVTLPTDAKANILSGSFDSVPIIALAVTANNGNNDALGRNLADIASPIFSTVPGVRDVTVSGVRDKRVNIKLDTTRMLAFGVSQQSISTALQSNGFIVPAGTITDSQGGISVQIGTPVATLTDIQNLPLIGSKVSVSTPSIPSASNNPFAKYLGGAGAGAGAPSGFTMPSTTTTSVTAVALKDVATVTYDNAPLTSISRVNGKPALTVSITKTQDGNTVAVSQGVQAKIDEFKQKLGDVTVVTEFDQAPFVQKSLENLTSEGLLGLGFAIIVILLFLLSVRSTLVTAISIPTSVLITFIGLSGFGYSLNLFTLSALTIAIGRVVDDSIVVIENINRHLSYGEPKKVAVLSAVREVAGAITSATITTVAVFLPIATVGGLIGQLFRPFSLTFTIALLSSLLVSLTIVPVLAYWFMKAKVAETADDAETAEALKAAAREAEEQKERKGWLQKGYLPVITKTQKHPVLTIIGAFLVLIFTFSLVPQLKTDFLGSSGSSGFVLNETLAPGATLAQQDKAAAKVEAILLAHPEVKVVQTSIGSSGDGRVAFGAAAGGISIQVTTHEGADQAVLQDALTKQFNADASLGTVKFNTAGGPSFGGSSTVDIKVVAKTDAALETAIGQVEAAMKGTANVTDITNSLASKQRTLKITVNRLAAAKKGLSEVAVSGIVAGAMHPTSIGNANINNTATSIYIVKSYIPSTIDQIKAISVPTASGTVALSSIASVALVKEPVSITSEKGDRTATVSLTPSGNNLGAITKDVTARLDKVTGKLPPGVTATIGGVSASQASSFSQLGTALLAAIAIVFIVMVATFSSIAQPLILLISIPFAATGAFGLLLATDTPLGVPSLIGMLLLVGVVVTNAIVLIDLINQYRKQGKPLRESILDGARQRLRPILMTALATIFALTPMALGVTGGGGFISQPLAIVVIGGLFSSTILTLVIVPTLYLLVEGSKERRAEKRIAKRQAKATA